ncbi:MAG: lytic transglycosylase domain-containing protein [Candidatus Symbiothrix sp.]|nr:lytic transglycosylase domain-containing protein [Candidatus Symbiothrix sp.]
MLIIKRANRYFPIIEPILAANNIPDDFKYLCVIESNLDTRALSPAKAAGLWQFMEGTAKNYGLEIRDGVDERYHIEKATEAACNYFRAAYQKYHNWMDVAASYNAGTGRISSQLNQQDAESAFDLLLVSETSRYMFRILAAKELLSHPKRYGYVLKKENLYPHVPVDYVEVSTNVPDWAAFAKQYGISYATLKEFNVWLRDTKLEQPKKAPAKTYYIAIPKKEDLQFDVKKIRVHNKAWVTD